MSDDGALSQREALKRYDKNTVEIGECLPGLDEVYLGVLTELRNKIAILVSKIMVFTVQKVCLVAELPMLYCFSEKNCVKETL